MLALLLTHPLLAAEGPEASVPTTPEAPVTEPDPSPTTVEGDPDGADTDAPAASYAETSDAQEPPAGAAAESPAPDTGSSNDPRIRQARRVIARGESLFAASNYEGALAEFSEAYRLLDAHPMQYIVLYNIAVCHERAFRYEFALKYYREYLSRAPESDPSRQKVVGVVSTLESLLATLEVESNTAAEAWSDDRFLGRVPGKLLLPSGRYTIEIKAKGYESVRQEITLAAGQTKSLSFELTRLSTQHGPHPAYFATALGLSATALITGGVLGSLALSEHQAGQRVKDDGGNPEPYGERASDLALAADVAFGSALVFGASATLLYFVTDWDSEHEPGTRDTARGLRIGASPWAVQAEYTGCF